jgi:16S rRNA (cytidine1402-2'-O)-methyltransferase
VESALYVVATPIGNLGDITQRALDVLERASLIAAEDTRHSARLLKHFNISTPLMAYHDHSDERSVARIKQLLEDGEAVALISDAGTPLISDPGYRLVKAVREAGYAVVPVPGACAAIAALSASGLPTDRFSFEGFLSAKAGSRGSQLDALRDYPSTLVFYEAPHRVLATLEAMAVSFGQQRRAVVARELTKTFETLLDGTLQDLVERVRGDTNQQRGEIVIMVAPGKAGQAELDAALAGLLFDVAALAPPKRAASIVANFSGVPKKQLYDYLLANKSDD